MAALPDAATESTATILSPRTLTTRKVLVLLLGAMTPLAVVAGTVPLGLAFGGPSMSWAFIIAGIIIGLFCIGYSQMVQRMNRPGAFYGYITRGLGRPFGVGAGMVAVFGYWIGLISVFAVQSFVMQQSIATAFGLNLPWQVYLVVIPLILAVLAYRKVDLSANVVGIAVVCEVILLVALIIGILARNGFTSTFHGNVLSFDVFGKGQWTVAFVFAILCFQGYESGAMYSPEAKNPGRTIPRALYLGVGILSVLYVLATWALISLSGTENIQEAVVKQGIVGYVFGAVGTYLGPVGLWFFALFTFTAQFACSLALVNFMPRYVQSLAAEDLLPKVFAKKNRFGAPAVAMISMVASSAVVVFLLTLAGLDPYTQISSAGFGIGALVATFLQALASAAVVGFFLRRPRGDRHWWKTFLAPVLATILLGGAIVVELNSFSWITGTKEAWTAVLPWAIVAVFVLGVAFSFWLRLKRPDVYADLSAGDSAEEAAAIRELRIETRTGAVATTAVGDVKP